MRFVAAAILFLLAIYAHLLMNFYGNGWQYVQPFLIALLLLYFNVKEQWLVYVFAFLAGLLIDSISALFGFHTIAYLAIIFILRNLQLTTFTSRNILTVLLLTLWSFIFYWLLVWLGHIIFGINSYYVSVNQIWPILKIIFLNTVVMIFLHVWHYNFWVKRHEKQSF